MNIFLAVRNRTAVGMSAVAALMVALIPFTTTSRANAAAASGIYHQTNLVSDLPGVALIQDPDLVNPWGISMSATSPFWVANNGSGTSTLYAGDVNGSPFVKNALVVNIPGGLPTGTVFNSGGANDFIVSAGTASGRATFLFASQVGIVSGWNPGVPPPPFSTAAQGGGDGRGVYHGI